MGHAPGQQEPDGPATLDLVQRAKTVTEKASELEDRDDTGACCMVSVTLTTTAMLLICG